MAGSARRPRRRRPGTGQRARGDPMTSPATDQAPSAVAPALVEVAHISRTFGAGHTAVRALHDVSATIRQGQLTALIGRSGSGKTTLLNVIGGLDRPTSGTVMVA